MTKSVNCDRFDAHGKITETGVEFSVTRVGGRVFVHIKAKGTPTDLIMPIRAWCQLDTAITEGPGVGPLSGCRRCCTVVDNRRPC